MNDCADLHCTEFDIKQNKRFSLIVEGVFVFFYCIEIEAQKCINTAFYVFLSINIYSLPNISTTSINTPVI